MGHPSGNNAPPEHSVCVLLTLPDVSCTEIVNGQEKFLGSGKLLAYTTVVPGTTSDQSPAYGVVFLSIEREHESKKVELMVHPLIQEAHAFKQGNYAFILPVPGGNMIYRLEMPT